MKLLLGLLWLSCMLVFAVPAARAQNLAVDSITTVDLGNVVAAASGTTTFRISPATGSVSVVSGTGTRLSTASTRALVTVSCGGQGGCASNDALIAINTTGTPTNRAAALQNFTVSASGATATLTSIPGTGSAISFTIGPVGRNSTKTFWVGFDMPVRGDNSGANSGLSTAQFVVTVSRTDGSRASSLAGTAQATVFRGLSIGKTSDLAFGTIVRPASGSGTVSLSPGTGTVTTTGTGTTALASPTPASAAFAINGEGGQSVSITVPGTFAMSGPGGSLTVTTASTGAGAQFLSGTIGSSGTASVSTGGSFPISSGTPTGTYSGVLTVTVQYN